jgi:catalase
MQGVPDEIKLRQIALFGKCDPAYGAGVAKAVRLEPPGDDRLKGTSATNKPKEASTAI